MALPSKQTTPVSALLGCQRKRDLAKYFGISRSRLRWFASQINEYPEGKTTNSLYTRLWKPKRGDGKWLRVEPLPEVSDGYRPIDNPIDDLKVLQRHLHDDLSRLEVPTWLFAPAVGKSYVDNAAAHSGSAYFHLLDLEAYFPSCKSHRVFEFFRKKLNCSSDVAEILARLTTLGGSLPQGSPSSPILAYYSNMDVWKNVADFCQSEGVTLSVYADDITLSSNRAITGDLIWRIKTALYSKGLATKMSKEASIAHKSADITGVIVGEKGVRPPNRQIKRLKELEEMVSHQPDSVTLVRKIRGRRAQLKQIVSVKNQPTTKD